MTATFIEDVPLSVIDGGDDMMRVTFTYRPGADPSPRTMAEPNGGDDGYPPEIEVLEAMRLERRADGKTRPVSVLAFNDAEHDKIADWLLETWEPPTGPDPDDERDRRRDEEMTDGR